MTGHTWLDVIISVIAALLVSWLALIAALAIRRPKGNMLKEALRLLPDLLRHRPTRTRPAGISRQSSDTDPSSSSGRAPSSTPCATASASAPQQPRPQAPG